MIVAYRTDSGKVRETNQDNFLVDEAMNLFMVADGISGRQGGEVASTMSVQTVHAFLQENLKSDDNIPSLIQESIKHANSAIYERSGADINLKGMSSTLVLALLHNKSIFLTHVGDSKAYLIRSDEIKKLTKDHSLAEELLRIGELTEEDVKDYSLRHMVTRAMGLNHSIETEIQTVQQQEGDYFLLCTDGLTNMLDDEEIKDIILNKISPQAILEELISEANKKGGEDNITLIVISFKNNFEQD